MATSHKYKKRKMWDKEDMAAAITAVREKKIGYLKAAKQFNVPRSTLFRFVNDKVSPIESITNKVVGRRPVFGQEIEKLLVEYVLNMETKFYGLTTMDLRRLAYQLALKNNIKNPFKGGFAGRYWVKGFLKRHQDILSIRQPIGTSQARVNGFTKERMDEFYDNLEKIQAKKSFPASRIFNVDQSGFSIVQSKIPKVVARKGKKQIGAMSSAERESLITVVICMSSAGLFVPPMIIFPRKNMSDALMRGAPVGSIGKAHPSGWIQTHLFTEWFEHFVDYVKPTEASPVLLILDGHYSHTKNIHLIDLAEKHYVTILSIPPHCSHKVQPLDRTFMGPLKSYYSEEVRMFLREINRPLTPYDVVELFGKAYIRCQTGEIAADGFRVSGIYPFNRNIFTQVDYMAAAVDFDLQFVQLKKSDEENRKQKKNSKGKSKKKITKKTMKRNMTGSHSTDPYRTISGNNTDFSDYIAIKNETEVPTDEDADSLFGDGKYSENKRSEEWVLCLMCELWVHRACDSYESGVFICDYCKNGK